VLTDRQQTVGRTDGPPENIKASPPFVDGGIPKLEQVKSAA